MDSVFQEIPLDTVPEGCYSFLLTELVNRTLNGDTPNATRSNVIDFSKKLLMGDDDNMPSRTHKSLPYIARTCTGDPPVCKVVVTVARVTENLEDVLVNRANMYKQLEIVKHPIEILSTCLKMIMSDPRKYIPDELSTLINGSIMKKQSDTTKLTYTKKPDESKPYAKRTESTLDESSGERSPKRTKVYNDVLEGAEGLFVLKTSPPRVTKFASPRSRNISSISSVMSEGTDVSIIDTADHSKTIRMLEHFYTDKSESTSSTS